MSRYGKSQLKFKKSERRRLVVYFVSLEDYYQITVFF